MFSSNPNMNCRLIIGFPNNNKVFILYLSKKTKVVFITSELLFWLVSNCTGGTYSAGRHHDLGKMA